MDPSSVRWQLTDARDVFERLLQRRWRWVLAVGAQDEALLVEAMAHIHACVVDVPVAHHDALQDLLASMDALDRGLGSGVGAGWRLWTQRRSVAQVADRLDVVVAALAAAAPEQEPIPRLVGSTERRQRVRVERQSSATVRTAG